ncbi:MAG: hypothetical protein LUI09_03910, partial [Prevotellaceae bacterium]|nr:hypothetical protein [Prevotellaceae bacterium]
YKDGQLDGLHERWHANGQPLSRGSYKDGQLDGLHERWHANGQLAYRGSYKDGKRDGLHEEWFLNGQLAHRVVFRDGWLDERLTEEARKGKEKMPSESELRFREDDGEERRREEPWERDEGERRKLADYLMGNDYVAELTGQEFNLKGADLVNAVSDYYSKEFGGKVEREGYGEVILGKDGVRTSLHHGRVPQRMAAAFAAVPYIIRDGREIDNEPNWKDRGYESATFAAPLKIGKGSYIGVVVVRKGENGDNFRFHLHKVTAQKGLRTESSTAGSSPERSDSKVRGIAKVLRDIIQPKENGIKITEEGEESSNDTVSDSAANEPEDVRRTDGNSLGEQFGTPSSDKPGSAGEGLGTTAQKTQIPRIRGGERVADRIYRAIAGRLGVSEAEGRSESPGRPAANRHNAQRLTSRAGSGYLSRRLLRRGRNAST